MKWSGKTILPVFGALTPSQVTEAMVKEFVASSRNAPSTVWTQLNHLRNTMTWAVKHKHTPSANHFALPPPSPPREAYLTKDQARDFLSHCRFAHVHLFTTLALATGARGGALLELTWDRVDMDRRLIHLRTQDMENKKGRATVPINEMAYAALVLAKQAAVSGYVIEWAGERVKSIRRGIKRVATRSDLPFVSPHIFRHSAAVWMAEAGVPMEEIAQYLGHSNVEITRKVYARFSPQYLKKAAGALEL